MIILYAFFLTSYLFVSFWVFFTSSLWSIYFGLELQWMVLTILIIVKSMVQRGLINYIMLNALISVWLILGIVFNNMLFFMIGILGKIGFFPFSILVAYQYYLSSYNWIMFDLLNKIAYFNVVIVTINTSTNIIINFGLFIIILNFLIIMFFIKFILSLKHIIFISSLQWYFLILNSLLFQDELFAFTFLLVYTLTSIMILAELSYFCNGSFTFFTNLKNIKQYVYISYLFLVIYFMIMFSFIPTLLFLLKFMFMFNFINHAFGLVFSIIIFIVFIYQGFYLRTLCMILIKYEYL